MNYMVYCLFFQQGIIKKFFRMIEARESFLKRRGFYEKEIFQGKHTFART